MEDFLKKLLDTEDFTKEFDAADAQKNKGMCVLAYLSWLLLIPYFVVKDSPYTKFHCNQGIILAILETVVWLVMGVFSFIPVLNVIFWILGGLLSLVFFLLFLFGLINVLNGNAKELPLIGKFRILK